MSNQAIVKGEPVTNPHAKAPSFASSSQSYAAKQTPTLGSYTDGAASGVQKLMLGVLKDALACWYRYYKDPSYYGRLRFRETYEWFWSDDQSWLYAFVRICDHLNLDPRYIRSRLARQRRWTLWQDCGVQPSRSVTKERRRVSQVSRNINKGGTHVQHRGNSQQRRVAR